jgi:hypothetical protein
VSRTWDLVEHFNRQHGRVLVELVRNMPETMRIEVGLELDTITCSADGCGITFAVPSWWAHERRRDHATWYCPNGHRRCWPSKSDIEKLQEQLATANGNLNYYRDLSRRRSEEIGRIERQRTSLRGQVTKLKKRATAGMCAFCHRRFGDYASHMATKHPKEPFEGED